MNNKQYQDIAINKIRENPNNPRNEIGSVEDLKASINANGLLQNITVRPLDDGTFEVIAGSRRFKACRELGLQRIPCTIIEADEDKAYELATTENIVRENMTAVDEANAVAKLFAQGKSRTEIGAMFGKSARWAEGRRKIVELGDKAMEYLAAGKINLGHAEVLTMCRPEDVEKWLSTATYRSPEELKVAIMNERPLLERAPFNAKKICRKCEKRSDRQTDLFGDIQCSHCLDRECFTEHVKNEAERIRKKYTDEGYDEVADFWAAQGGWGGYIDADSTAEDDKEQIEKLKAKGVKPKFWVDDKTAEHGLSYIDPKEEDTDDDEDGDDERNENPDSWDWQMNHMDYRRREKVYNEASAEEKRIVANRLKAVFGNISTTAKAFILEILNRSYRDEDGNNETYLKYPYDAAANFLDEVADAIVDDWCGVNADIREYLGMESREEFVRTANDALPYDSDENEG